MHIGKRAIVIGAGVGGLSAAKALVDSFEYKIAKDTDARTI